MIHSFLGNIQKSLLTEVRYSRFAIFNIQSSDICESYSYRDTVVGQAAAITGQPYWPVTVICEGVTQGAAAMWSCLPVDNCTLLTHKLEINTQTWAKKAKSSHPFILCRPTVTATFNKCLHTFQSYTKMYWIWYLRTFSNFHPDKCVKSWEVTQIRFHFLYFF